MRLLIVGALEGQLLPLASLAEVRERTEVAL